MSFGWSQAPTRRAAPKRAAMANRIVAFTSPVTLRNVVALQQHFVILLRL
jgi:hypothetical protein